MKRTDPDLNPWTPGAALGALLLLLLLFGAMALPQLWGGA